MRNRAFGALIHLDRILMVEHQHDGKIYWTLPGGGLEANESFENAVKREFKEETQLGITVERFLFDEAHYTEGISRCFLVKALNSVDAKLGTDPEDSHLAKDQRMLQALKWFPLDKMKKDKQVARVLDVLKDA